MENLVDSSATLLSLPTSSGTEQQSTAPLPNHSNGSQQQVSLPATTPLLGTDQLTSPQQITKPAYVANPYPSTTSAYPMNYGNYQGNYGQGGSYGSTPQGYSSIGMGPYGTSASGTTPNSYPHSAYPQTTGQQGSTAQPNTASPSQLSTHNYGAYPYNASTSNYAQANFPISSQYAQQTNAHMNSHVNYQPMQPQPTYQPPSGQSLMTQMNNNQGLALPKATTPRAGPTKRRRASEDTAPKPVKPAPTVNDSDNWERGQYQPTVRKRAKKSYGDDEDDEDIDDDIEEDDDDMLQRTERKSLRERKPSKKGEKEKKSPSTSTSASPRVTPKKKETKVDEEEVEEEQGNLEVELEFPEDSLIETDEETHTKKYNKIIFNGNTYVIGDTIAFWPEGKKGRPPMGTIKSFSTDGENNTVDCCWFYRVEETNLKGKRRQKIGPREVFLSEHTDPNACESIWKKVSIKSKYEVPDLEEYVKEADCYYYSSKFNHLELTFEDL
jgi:hypothetical protein